LTSVKISHVIIKMRFKFKKFAKLNLDYFTVVKAEIAKDTSRDFDYAILELATLSQPTDTCQK